MRLLDFLLDLKAAHCCPWSRERNMPASNSDVRRWIQSGAVLINGVRSRTIDDVVEFPVTELVWFPNGKNRTSVR